MTIVDRHRTLALAAFIPFTLTVLSGMTYRICRQWFHMEKKSVGWLMDIHHMSLFGMQSIYPIFVGLLVLGLVGTGFGMKGLSNSIFCCCGYVGRCPAFPKKESRSIHRFSTTIFLVPIFITGTTGLLYSLGRDSLNFQESTLRLLMWLHQGSWTGSAGAYVLLNGLGFLVVLASGVAMSELFQNKCGDIERERYMALKTLDNAFTYRRSDDHTDESDHEDLDLLEEESVGARSP
eukprot:g64671.t1